MEEASVLFADSGTPRSPRTIIRYCARGHLGCIKVDTEQNEKYLISRESIDRRIEEIRQVARSSRVSTQRDVSRPDESGRASDEPPAEESPKLRKKLEALEAELFDQKIANRAKTQYIEKLETEHSNLIERLQIQSRQIGRLETRLELQAGKPVDQLPDAIDASQRDSLSDAPRDTSHRSSDVPEESGPDQEPADD